MLTKEWIDRLRRIARNFRVRLDNIEVPRIRRFFDKRRALEAQLPKGAKMSKHPDVSALVEGQVESIERTIAYQAEMMREQEDVIDALSEYAATLERLAECRAHMIPHRHDAEIIDYIATGKKNNQEKKENCE